MSNAAMDLFNAALASEQVSGPLAELAKSIYAQESSSGANTATSNAGAVGGMQIIPSTFASVADKGWDIKNPEHNLRAGIRYLKYLDGLSGGDARLTAAGYYGGPGGMQKAKAGIAVSDPRNPHAPDTLQYADQVVGRTGGAPAPQAAQAFAVADVPQNAQAVPETVPVQATPELPSLASFQSPLQGSQEVPPEWEAFRNWIPRREAPVREPRQPVAPQYVAERPRPADFSESLGMAQSMMARNQAMMQNGWQAMQGWV